MTNAELIYRTLAITYLSYLLSPEIRQWALLARNVVFMKIFGLFSNADRMKIATMLFVSVCQGRGMTIEQALDYLLKMWVKVADMNKTNK